MTVHLRILLVAVLLSMSYSDGVRAQSSKLILETAPQETEIPLSGSVVISQNGDLRATPVDLSACQATGSCQGVNVAVTSFGSNQETNGVVTVDEGQSFVLSWKSLGATVCNGLGTFSNWAERSNLPPDSRDATTVQGTIATSQGDSDNSPYQLQIQCANGSVVSSLDSVASLSLVVNEVVAPSPTSCVGREPISGWSRLTTGALGCVVGDSSADCRNWTSVWPNPFLQSNGLTRKILTNRSDERQYVAIQFDTNDMAPTASGRFNLESAGGSIRKEPLIVTISKCPGDFNPDQVTGCYFTPLFSFRWRGPQSTSSASCVLEPNTVYYLNMLSSGSPSGTLPNDIQPVAACDSALCGVLIQTN